MTGGHGLNEEKEEDSKLGFEHLVSDLRLEIIGRLCESVDTKAEVVFDSKTIRHVFASNVSPQALVRREERQLELRGDFSLPPLTSKVWLPS